MKQSVWNRLDLFARNVFPFCITLALVMLSSLPLRLPDLSPVLPSLALVAVYYWSVYRPDLMPEWAVFLVGLFQDLLVGGIPGAGALTFLAVNALVKTQRRFFANASFFVVWFMFALFALGAQALLWALNAAFRATLIDPEPALFQTAMTVAVFPLLAWLFAQSQRSVLR